MTTPLYALLWFTVWTVGIATVGIGAWRVGNVLMGKARPNAFPADTPHGPEWYRRVIRAHLNCVENLPVFAALVLIGHVSGVTDGTFATLAQVVAAARVGQTLAHIASGRSLVVNIRFTFFLTQLICFFSMAVILLRHG
jgi:uncharacterized MAPEG superfamily protein